MEELGRRLTLLPLEIVYLLADMALALLRATHISLIDPNKELKDISHAVPHAQQLGTPPGT